MKEQNLIKFKRIENPFEGIDFGNGIINHLETDFSRENLRKGLLLLQVRYSSYILDIGWYGSEKGYIIRIIKNQNWKDPILKAHKAFYDLPESTKSAVQLIEKELHK
jgi:hypothetical protein